MYMAIEYIIITDTDNPAIPLKTSCYTVYVDLLASQIFGELVGNCCWCYFNLAKCCSC